MEAPDYINPLIGFRHWKLKRVRTGLLKSRWQLIGPHTKEIWSPRVNQASCAPSPEVRRAPIPLGLHQAPHPDCVCGLYAHRSRQDNRMLGFVVEGAVKMWGKIEVHPEGARAQCAEPLALVSNPPDNFLKVYAGDEMQVCLKFVALSLLFAIASWLLPLPEMLTGICWGAALLVAAGFLLVGAYGYWEAGEVVRAYQSLPALAESYGIPLLSSQELEAYSFRHGAPIPDLAPFPERETQTYYYTYYEPDNPEWVLSCYPLLPRSYSPHTRGGDRQVIRIKPLELPVTPWGYQTLGRDQLELLAVRAVGSGYRALVLISLALGVGFAILITACLTAANLVAYILAGMLIAGALISGARMHMEFHDHYPLFREERRAKRLAQSLGIPFEKE